MTLLSVSAAVLVLATPPAAAAATHPLVVLETSKGSIVLELFADRAPETVENFLEKVESGFYDGTVFHRVVRGFMIQGGGMTADDRPKPPGRMIRNEADHGLSNERGTVAMARQTDPHSATAQFFVNLVDNVYLDHQAKTQRGWGYTVFGRVVEGMEVVDAIADVPVRRTRISEAQPLEPVVIRRALVRQAEAQAVE